MLENTVSPPLSGRSIMRKTPKVGGCESQLTSVWY